MFPKQSGFVPRERFIAAMRHVASSVTVVTTDGPEGRFGATVSAFTSVSADPPTVLVCLSAESRIARAVSGNGSFCINVLPEDGVEVADRFAGRHDNWIEDRFSGIDCHGLVGEAPLIDRATGFHAQVQQTLRSGSHLIVIGHVRDVLGGAANPLAYRDGSYHRVVPQDHAIAAAAG